MLKNYLKIALRALAKHKGHTVINVFGLAVGVACCLLIGLFVRHEWSYDRFHTNADRLYRAWTLEDYGEDRIFFNAVTPIPLGPTLEETFPEVEETIRVDNFQALVQRADRSFSESVTFVDPAFFEVFDFELRQGEAATVLADPASVVLTPEIAARYFPELAAAEVRGQTLSIQVGNDFREFRVTGVAETPPVASSIPFSLVVPYAVSEQLYNERARQSWQNVFGETYVLLAEGVPGAALEAKMPQMIRQIQGDRYVEGQMTVGLQPLTDIHLNPEIPAGFVPPSDPAYSYILGAIALFVLLIACINFMTLAVGRSASRALEVGVRKAIGAGRRQLMLQFWGEALLLTALAVTGGVALAYVFQPLFNALAGRELVLSLDAGTVGLLLALLVLIGLAAGSYPAAVLSGFRPIEVLKGSIRVQGDTSLLRRGLVVVQFALSIFLIAVTIVMARQLDHLQTQNLGFDQERLVVVPTGVPNEEGERIAERYRTTLAGHDAVAGLTASAFPLNAGWGGIGYTDDAGIYRNFFFNVVDARYFATMAMTLAEGRGFSDEIPADRQRAVVVNEAFLRAYGWTEGVGKRLPGRNFPEHEIIGVVADFNFQSLHTEVAPAVLVMDLDVLRPGIENIEIFSSPRLDLAVRLRAGDLQEQVALLETTWATVAPGQDFNFYFLDEALDAQYRQEERLRKIVSIAAGLAILIACLGLFGLAALAAARRTKEIGIRKVMGADVPSLVVLLSKDFTLLVLVAFVVAAPAAYFALDAWLQDFAFRVSLGVGTFFLAGLAALVIAWLTVGYQSIKAALADPVRSLRYE